MVLPPSLIDFTSVFTKEKQGEVPLLADRGFIETLSHIAITEDIVSKGIEKLNPSKSPGPDNIHPPHLLKEMSSIFVDPLTRIFHSTISIGRLPRAWNYAAVVPI